MMEVIVFAEGPTEEQFIKLLVAPALRSLQVFVKPQMLKTSQEARGGAVNFDRLKFNARNTLRQKPNAVLTTLLDLYGLDTTFPGFEEAKAKPDLDSRVNHLNTALANELVAYVDCRPERFIAHIQPYEFEGLLFSDPHALAQTEPGWQASLAKLTEVRAAFPTPEHINDSYETKPSRRLEQLLQPGYKKTRHGPLAAKLVSLATMENECPHFHGWMESLRRLGGMVA
ncbi:hypothetical protein BBC27_14155 [Acidithiobacillus ferrivorans]|uniref:DUF4276 family protein n=1 Tax=Acidithiobacillus ferrivorans TaxID=160808 RepID=A0A1B9BWU2_9PROT|nr:DUF4276 family protein [Acidithiobacillus ferrivorans]OCB02195.1 hypothetical protein BBC27_14155 [Acidithiobacillus ferrivorans]